MPFMPLFQKFFLILFLIKKRDYMLLVPLLGAATHFPVEEKI